MGLVLSIPRRQVSAYPDVLMLIEHAPQYAEHDDVRHGRLVQGIFPTFPCDLSLPLLLIGKLVVLEVPDVHVLVHDKPVTDLVNLWNGMRCYAGSLLADDRAVYCSKRCHAVMESVQCQDRDRRCGAVCQFECIRCPHQPGAGDPSSLTRSHEKVLAQADADWCPNYLAQKPAQGT
mgnify:CR=1 FL=1